MLISADVDDFDVELRSHGSTWFVVHFDFAMFSCPCLPRIMYSTHLDADDAFQFYNDSGIVQFYFGLSARFQCAHVSASVPDFYEAWRGCASFGNCARTQSMDVGRCARVR